MRGSAPGTYQEGAGCAHRVHACIVCIVRAHICGVSTLRVLLHSALCVLQLQIVMQRNECANDAAASEQTRGRWASSITRTVPKPSTNCCSITNNCRLRARI